MIIAVAVNSDGQREVLGMAIGASEADHLRHAEGLKAAVAKVLNAP